jgi:LuxR family maltose regulon positive regulatory protein
MTDRPVATYGPSTITNQPNTDDMTKSGTTVHLTPAEARVLRLLPTYLTLAAIGTELGIGRPTVKTHVENIYKKLGATTRAEAVKLAEAARLLPGPRPAGD